MSYSTAYRGPAIGTDVPPPWGVGHRLRDLLTDVDTHGGAGYVECPPTAGPVGVGFGDDRWQ